MKNALTISQLNRYIKSIIENDQNLIRVFAIGEISNFNNHYRSGHLYLSLKDSGSVISAIMYKGSASRLKFTPKDGLKVLVRGRISLYEPNGQYQIVIDDMQPDGIGALNLAYTQLWEKLNNQNLFNPIHKKTLKKYPTKIAVITSPTGAAVQDIISTLSFRWPPANIKIYPCTVQGEKAEGELISSLVQADQDNNDVIIIGRGGGSIEDLWAFNSEKLALKIFDCNTPIISGVGHENDFTICDYVADLRAITPTDAAVLAVPDIKDEIRNLNSLTDKLNNLINSKIENYSIKLDSIPDPLDSLTRNIDKNDNLYSSVKSHFISACNLNLEKNKNRLSLLNTKLDSLSPLKIMSLGYSVLKKNNTVIHSINQIEHGDNLTAVLQDGEIQVISNKNNPSKLNI